VKRIALALCASMFASSAQAAHWNVDYAKSRLGFTVDWSKEPFSGGFQSWKADIDFDPADLSHARADVTIDPASEKSDEPDFDDGLMGPLGFDVKAYPSARFTATRFTHSSGDNYVAEGTLTVRGVAKPITLPFTVSLKGGEAHMVGKAVVLRTDFGVGSGLWAKPDPVAHEVTVTVDLLAHKTP
jgi:polyisoprenoid-binding protein YceI